MKQTYKRIKIPGLDYIFRSIKKELLANVETDYDLILIDKEHKRSTEISTHFHAHVWYITKMLIEAGIKISREQIYFECLLLACEMETEDGASPYPFVYVEREIITGHYRHPITREHLNIYKAISILEPLRTSDRSNKQLMQGVEATHRYASVIVCEKYGLEEGIILPESGEWNDDKNN